MPDNTQSFFQMIICITPNPAIDRTIILSNLILGNVHRAQKTMVAAGGKGLNVARTIQRLGGQPLCMGFAGGHSGRLLADLAQNEGLRSSWTWTEAETRTCTILVSAEKDATLINEPGTPISSSDWNQLQQDVGKELASVDRVCISGSLPPNSSVEQFHSLLSMLVEAGKQVWVDTSGPALTTALANPQICTKVNGNEMGEALGLPVNDFSSAGRALDLLGSRAPPACVITLGSAGALLAARKERWLAKGTQVRVISTVGSGDSFLGGFVNALDRGEDWPEALRSGIAAGTANALSAGGGRFTLQDFQMIREQTKIQSW
jgi:1-phosphofructokinase family hexose kinase